ncbi:UNVERIFIED_CONTAM: hypothetical protein FKN15_058684 [Acipenser sinensis]
MYAFENVVNIPMREVQYSPAYYTLTLTFFKLPPPHHEPKQNFSSDPKLKYITRLKLQFSYGGKIK